MNRMVDRSVPQGDDIDALLGAFYKAQMPRKWPPFQAPPRSRTLSLRPATPRSRFAIGSRFALAASVALLLLAAWLLAGRFPGAPAMPGGPDVFGAPKAERHRPHELPIPVPGPDNIQAPGKMR
jgi:hypothetical protein